MFTEHLVRAKTRSQAGLGDYDQMSQSLGLSTWH